MHAFNVFCWLQGLNVNGGRGKTSEIRLRLRHHHAPNAFLAYEDVLGTMLHEITHNVRGPHDAEFYKLLDEVTKECEDFMARGIAGTGIGFDGPSVGRLGAHGFMPVHNGSEEAMKRAQIRYVADSIAGRCCTHVLGCKHAGQLARVESFIGVFKLLAVLWFCTYRAAEKRRQQASLMSGPQRLGGATVKGMTPQQAAAAAAERRARDAKWCPTAAIAAGEVVDLLSDVEEPDEAQPSTSSAQEQRAVLHNTNGGGAAAAATPAEGDTVSLRHKGGCGCPECDKIKHRLQSQRAVKRRLVMSNAAEDSAKSHAAASLQNSVPLSRAALSSLDLRDSQDPQDRLADSQHTAERGGSHHAVDQSHHWVTSPKNRARDRDKQDQLAESCQVVDLC